jgi:hypothetical protein
MSTPEQNGPEAGSARRFLLALGVSFAALAIACVAFPSWNVPDPAVPVCALLAIGLIAIARFLPDRWVRRIESLLIGWP